MIQKDKNKILEKLEIMNNLSSIIHVPLCASLRNCINISISDEDIVEEALGVIKSDLKSKFIKDRKNINSAKLLSNQLKRLLNEKEPNISPQRFIEHYQNILSLYSLPLSGGVIKGENYRSFCIRYSLSSIDMPHAGVCKSHYKFIKS